MRIKTEIPIDGQTNFSGKLIGITDGQVILSGEGGSEIRIPYRSVKKARLAHRDIPIKG
ncbi:MAG: hypothetical protein L0213_11240 [Candidatus Dadabacteria bacterium]|nr:hypothetical protein [Candidatus Dadabacteria bacterium]